MIDHANRDHALLSASGAARWLACPPSARLEDTLPESQSVYADEGRLAHEVAELVLRKYITPMSRPAYNKALKKLKDDPLFKPEMVTHAEAYRDHIASIMHGMSAAPHVIIEKRVDFSAYVPEGFGTGDCIIIGDDKLYIIDYKYGQGVPVSANDNPQMKLYGLGALNAYSFLFPVEQVHMIIYQPRLDSVSECVLPVGDLLAWGDEIKPIADMAFAGEGVFAAGDHCRFCRAKAQCRHRSDVHTALEDFGMVKPPLLSDDEVGDLLERAQHLSRWISDLQEYALARCLAGGEIAGWKVVAGRAVRQFADMDAAFEKLKTAGWDEALLYERKPLTLAGVEKLIGKPTFKELVGELVVTPPGKPALVASTDTREALTPISANEDFAGTAGAQDF